MEKYVWTVRMENAGRRKKYAIAIITHCDFIAWWGQKKKTCTSLCARVIVTRQLGPVPVRRRVRYGHLYASTYLRARFVTYTNDNKYYIVRRRRVRHNGIVSKRAAFGSAVSKNSGVYPIQTERHALLSTPTRFPRCLSLRRRLTRQYRCRSSRVRSLLRFSFPSEDGDPEILRRRTGGRGIQGTAN